MPCQAFATEKVNGIQVTRYDKGRKLLVCNNDFVFKRQLIKLRKNNQVTSLNVSARACTKQKILERL